MGAFLDKVNPENLHCASNCAVIMVTGAATVFEAVIIPITSGSEKREFRCKTTVGKRTELDIQEHCYQEYSQQYDQKQFPLSFFVGILILFLVPAVSLGYTSYIYLRRRAINTTYNGRKRTYFCKVFTAYMTQLVLRVIILAVVLCLQWVLYPVKFPSQFLCPAPQTDHSHGLKNNITGVNATNYNCTNEYAEEKTIIGGFLFAIDLLGFFLSFGEMVYLIRQVCKDPTYCEDEKFCPNYLSSETPENPITPPEQVELLKRGW